MNYVIVANQIVQFWCISKEIKTSSAYRSSIYIEYVHYTSNVSICIECTICIEYAHISVYSTWTENKLENLFHKFNLAVQDIVFSVYLLTCKALGTPSVSDILPSSYLLFPLQFLLTAVLVFLFLFCRMV